MSKTTESMNLLLADIHVLYTKIQNYHWNVKGPYFFGMHDKTEEYYNHFATIYDELAERVLQLEGKPIVTLKQVLELSRLKKTDRQILMQPMLLRIFFLILISLERSLSLLPKFLKMTLRLLLFAMSKWPSLKKKIGCSKVFFLNFK